MLFYVFYIFYFQNVLKPCDVTKLRLLQSRELADLIRALKHCFQTKYSHIFQNCYKCANHY